MSKLLHGDSAARLVSERIAAKVTTLTVLKQTPKDRRVDGQIVHVEQDNTTWQFNDEATCNGDDVLAVNPSDAPSTGRWMRMPGAAMLAIPFLATTPSGTNLLTVPSNTILAPLDFGVRVSRIFTGLAGAVVGLSSSNHWGHTGPFNFIGSTIATQLNQYFSATANGTGAGAFLQAPLALNASSSVPSGRIDSPVRPWMKGGDTFRHDVGTAFGTGVGEWLVMANILQNPGV